MKNTLREAMLGPSVLLLALSAISTGSVATAAGNAHPSKDVPITTPLTMTAEPAAPPAEIPAPAAPLVVQAHPVQTAPKAGEPLDIVIEVKNTSEAPQTLHFTSGKRFDVKAFKAGEAEPVWTWSAGRMFTMALRDSVLEPGATQTFKAKWPAPPQGTFSLRASVTANGGIDVAPFDVVVQ